MSRFRDPAMSRLEQAADDIRRCNRCGFCQEVCPTYGATGYEWAVARGRVRLLRRVVDGDELGAAAGLEEHLFSCILCGACQAACPSSVAADKLVTAARADLTEKWGLGLPQRAILHGVLQSPRRLAMPANLLRFYQKSGMGWAIRRTGLLGLSAGLDHLESLAPRLAKPRLRRILAGRDGRGKGLGGRSPAPGISYESPPGSLGRPRRARVTYFLGCLTDNLFPSVGQAVIGVLEGNGYEVVVPDNACCGMAQRAYGDVHAAARLARANLALLEATKADFIVSDCGSCLHALKEYPELLADAGAQVGTDADPVDVARRLAGKLRDVSQFLVQEGLVEKGLHPMARRSSEGLPAQNQTVTYHDPCHLGRGLGVRSEPRRLLDAIPGVRFEELPEADRCCGLGGSFGLTHREVSLAILDRKMDNFARTGAEVLATSCPSCLLQLGLGLRRTGLAKAGARVAHPLELMWESCQAAARPDSPSSG